MPRLMGQDANDMQNNTIGGSGFSFTGTRIEKLTALSYTLCTIIIDASGSVAPFAKQLDEMLRVVVQGAKKSARSDNILVRVLTFNSNYRPKGTNEIHGFKPLADIDIDKDYQPIHPSGGTPLFNASFDAIGATIDYGKQLRDLDYTVNGIVFIITDGGDTDRGATPAMIKAEMEKMLLGEQIESLISILIGINTASCGPYLDTFKNDAALTHYIDAGNATPSTIAKIGGFVLNSLSSQSQAVGTGGPSQQISATIP